MDKVFRFVLYICSHYNFNWNVWFNKKDLYGSLLCEKVMFCEKSKNDIMS